MPPGDADLLAQGPRDMELHLVCGNPGTVLTVRLGTVVFLCLFLSRKFSGTSVFWDVFEERCMKCCDGILIEALCRLGLNILCV